MLLGRHQRLRPIPTRPGQQQANRRRREHLRQSRPVPGRGLRRAKQLALNCRARGAWRPRMQLRFQGIHLFHGFLLSNRPGVSPDHSDTDRRPYVATPPANRQSLQTCNRATASIRSPHVVAREVPRDTASPPVPRVIRRARTQTSAGIPIPGSTAARGSAGNSWRDAGRHARNNAGDFPAESPTATAQ